MRKADFMRQVAEKSGLTKAQSDQALDAIIDTIKQTLASGDKIVFSGFGTFEVKERAEHMGRNPSTGEQMLIAAGKSPVFKASKAFKDYL
jgi:DNA-binding protein HU-beta